MLQPDKLKKLNENAMKMAEAGSSKEDILAMKDAFVKQFGVEEPIKKKESTTTVPQQSSASVQTNGSSDTQDIDPKTGFPKTKPLYNTIPDFKSIWKEKKSVENQKTFRLPNEADEAEMQRRGITPPPSEMLKQTANNTKDLYDLDANGNIVTEKPKYGVDFNFVNPLTSTEKANIDSNNKDARDIKDGTKFRLMGQSQKATVDNPELTENLYNFTDKDKKEILGNIDKKIDENDLNLDHPYLYFSSYDKPEQLKDSFVENNFGEEKLAGMGINPADFDGFLNKLRTIGGTSYKSEYLDKETKGLFEGKGYDVSGGYNIQLAKELQKQRLLSLYMQDINSRDFAKRKLKQEKENLNKSGANREEWTTQYTLFDNDKVGEYFEKEMPLLTQKLKERDAENLKIYEAHKNNDAGWLYGGEKVLKAGWNGFIDRVNQTSSTMLDKIGFDSLSQESKLLNEERQLQRLNNREIGYASGRTTKYDGVNYLVTDDGQIIDQDKGIIVTDMFMKPTYDKVVNQSKTGKEDYVFSPQGSAITLGSVLGDMVVQIAAQRGLSIVPTTGSLLSIIPISKGIGSAIIAQSALGYSQGLEQTYKAAINAGIDERTAKVLATDAAQRMAVLYAVTAPISPQTKAVEGIFGSGIKESIKKAISAYAKTGKKGFIETFKASLKSLPKNTVTFIEEGGKEVVQENIQQAGETYGVNAATNLNANKELLKETISGDEFVNTSILSFASGGLITIPGMFSSTDKLKTLQQLSKDPIEFEKNLKELVSKGVHTNEQADKLRKEVKIYSNQSNKIPKNTNPDIAMDIMTKLEEISDLELKKKGLDKSFHEELDNEIEVKRKSIKSKIKEDEQMSPIIETDKVSSKVSELEKQRELEIESLKSKRLYSAENITPIREKYDALILEEKSKDFDLFHTGSEGMSIESVSVDPRVTRQGRKGKYGGFYTYDNIKNIIDFVKGNSTTSIYGIKLNDGVEITDYNGSVERLDAEKLQKLRDSGIKVIRGKSLVGKTEIIVVDKSAIKEITKINETKQDSTTPKTESKTEVQKQPEAEKVAEVSPEVADIEKRREEDIKKYDERDARSIEAITPNNPNHPTFKVGMKRNVGDNVIVDKTNTDNWNGEGDGYTVITAIKSPAEFDNEGKMTKAAKIEEGIFNSKEEADTAVQATFEKVKNSAGKAQEKANAKYDAELEALKSKEPPQIEVKPEVVETAPIELTPQQKIEQATQARLEAKAKIDAKRNAPKEEVVDKVNTRLETRKAVKEGTDLFPETANIPELETENKPKVGDKVDFGEGEEVITGFAEIKGETYIKSKPIEGNMVNRESLNPLSEYTGVLSKQEEFAKRREENKKLDKEREDIEKTKEEKRQEAKKEYEDIDGFAENKTAIQKGKILQHLNKKVYRGTIKSELRRIANLPHRFIERDGKKRIIFTEENGTEFLLSDIYTTKTGLEYLQYLTEQPKAEKSKVESAKESLKEATAKRKETKAKLDAKKRNQGIASDPKQDAQDLYDYHQALVSEAKAYIEYGVASLEEFAEALGEKVTKSIKQAWEEAKGESKPITKGEDLSYDFNTMEEEVVVEKKEPKIVPKAEVKKPQPKKETAPQEETISKKASELGISDTQYEKLRDDAKAIPESGEYGKYLSGETIEDVFDEPARNEQGIQTTRLQLLTQHGEQFITNAKKLFGENYVGKTLAFLKNSNLNSFEKGVIYASMVNEANILTKEYPDNADYKAQQDAIYEDYQANLRVGALTVNSGRLIRILNAIEKGVDVGAFTGKLYSGKQKEAKQVLENAVPTPKNLNEIADEEAKIYTQEELDAEIEKAVQQEKVESKKGGIPYKPKSNAKKVKAQQAITAIERIQKRLRSKAYDASIGVPIAIIDGGLTVIKKSIQAGVTLSEAIERGINHIKNEYGQKWAKEDEFRKDMYDEFSKEGIDVRKQPSSISKVPDVIKEALIDAGFGREVKTKKTTVDENGVKTTETVVRNVLDWNKLFGNVGSIENLKRNVEEQLKKQGKSDAEIKEIQTQLEAEYKRLSEKIVDKALADLERRNLITPSVNRKSDAETLALLFRQGLFNQNMDKYENVLNKALGFSTKQQDVFDEIKKQVELLNELYEVKVDGKPLTELQIKDVSNKIKKAINTLVFESVMRDAPTHTALTLAYQQLQFFSLRGVLGSLKNLVENSVSSRVQVGLTEKLGGTKTTKELKKLMSDAQKMVKNDMNYHGGQAYGDTSMSLLTHSIVDDIANEKIKSKAGQFLYSLASLRMFLDAADSAAKVRLTMNHFIENAVKILTTKSDTRPAMSKVDAIKFVSEALTGDNFEKAKETAKNIIDDLNTKAGKKVFKDHESAIFRFALDIVAKNLANGDVMTMEQIEASFKAGEKSAGSSIGHVANNPLTEWVNSANNSLAKKQEKAIQEKEWGEATFRIMLSTIMKTTALLFKGGGTNWIVIGAEKGIPLVGLAHAGYFKANKVKGIDLDTEIGNKNLEQELYYQGRYRDTMVRGVYAMGMATLAAIVMQSKFGGEDDDETNAKKLAKWLSKPENKWFKSAFTKITPLAFSFMVAKEGKKEELGKYLGDLFNLGENYYDNGTQLIRSIKSNQKGTTKGALGKIATSSMNTPMGWKTAKDMLDIYRGLMGQPPLKNDKKAIRGFLEGATRGGFIEWVENVNEEGILVESKKEREQKQKATPTSY